MVKRMVGCSLLLLLLENQATRNDFMKGARLARPFVCCQSVMLKSDWFRVAPLTIYVNVVEGTHLNRGGVAQW